MLNHEQYQAIEKQAGKDLALRLWQHERWLETNRADRYAPAELRGINLCGLDLSGGKFDYITMLGCDLRGCNLEGTSFNKADLRGCNLRGAFTRRANFIAALGDGIDMTGTELERRCKNYMSQFAGKYGEPEDTDTTIAQALGEPKIPVLDLPKQDDRGYVEPLDPAEQAARADHEKAFADVQTVARTLAAATMDETDQILADKALTAEIEAARNEKGALDIEDVFGETADEPWPEA